MPTLTYSVSVSGGGVTIQRAVSRTSDGPIALESALTAGKTVTNWVKTDANTAACDLPGGHGYTNGNFDVFWSSGGVLLCRYNVPGTIATNALSLDGGSGTDFPASATTGVVVCRNVSATLLIDGDNLKHLTVVLESSDSASTAGGHITFEDAAGDDIAQVLFNANVPQVWDVSGGSSNPFTGDVVVSLICGVSADLTLKVIGMQDATP